MKSIKKSNLVLAIKLVFGGFFKLRVRLKLWFRVNYIVRFQVRA